MAINPEYYSFATMARLPLEAYVKLFGIAITALLISSSLAYAQKPKQEDPNINRPSHPNHETEATATRDFYVGQDGSKNHSSEKGHNPDPKKKTDSTKKTDLPEKSTK